MVDRSRSSSTRRRRSPEERRLLVESKAIKRREKIPDFVRVLSSPKGELQLSDKLRQDYAVLLLDEKSRRVVILCSVDATLRSTLDHNYESLKLRCESKSYHPTRVIASRDIIAIVYENERAGHKEQSDDARLRQASELQVAYDNLLLEALREEVSDIHLEVRRTRARVRFRKHGQLVTRHEWSVERSRSMATVVYQVIAEEKDVTFNEEVPQGAIVEREIDGQSLRVRIATMPAYPKGFDMVMRLLPMGRSRRVYDLPSLGYSDQHVKSLEKSVARPVGVTILSGTTGSGKSTSLVTMLSAKIAKFEGRIKVITVEDPPENEIDGATQVPVVAARSQEGKKNPFAEAIKAAMRSDPDVLMVGEVRDAESAKLLIGAVQSGHQAFTTVHAASAISIVSRLRSLGVSNDILGSQDFLSGLVYQSLVPVLCQSCSIPFNDYRRSLATSGGDSEIIQRILRVVPKIEKSHVRFRNAKGCKECVEGVTGRTVVAEVIVPDATITSYFAEGKDAQAWLHFRQNGGTTALDHGIEKMIQGMCCPHDVEAKLGLLDAQIEIVAEPQEISDSLPARSKVIESSNPSAHEVRDSTDWSDGDGDDLELPGGPNVIRAPFGSDRLDDE